MDILLCFASTTIKHFLIEKNIEMVNFPQYLSVSS